MPTPHQPDPEPSSPALAIGSIGRRQVLAGFGGFAAATAGGLFPLTASANWEVVRRGEREYVTGRSFAAFYGFAIDFRENHIWFRSQNFVVNATMGSQNLLVNSTKFILSYPIIQGPNRDILISRLDLVKLIDPILRPRFIERREAFDTVVIDPGHGGSDPGETGVYGNEANFTLQLGLLLRRELQTRGFRVVMTRDTDTALRLDERVAIANAVDNSVFVSLHFNSGPGSARGVETFALAPQGAESTIQGRRRSDSQSFQGNRRDAENIALATAVHAAIVYTMRPVDRGVKRARWTVLTGIERPAVLMEGGFVTNRDEGKLIATAAYLEKMAEALAAAVSNFRLAMSPRR